MTKLELSFLFLSFLVGLAINWWYFFYRKVLDCRSQKKQFDKDFSKVKVLEVFSHETGIRTIVVIKKFSHLLNSENLTPEFYVEIHRPEYVESFWSKNTFYRKFIVRSPKGVYLREYNIIAKKYKK